MAVRREETQKYTLYATICRMNTFHGRSITIALVIKIDVVHVEDGKWELKCEEHSSDSRSTTECVNMETRKIITRVTHQPLLQVYTYMRKRHTYTHLWMRASGRSFGLLSASERASERGRIERELSACITYVHFRKSSQVYPMCKSSESNARCQNDDDDEQKKSEHKVVFSTWLED